MERTGAKGLTGKVTLVLVSLLVGVLVGWVMNTQTAKEADVGRVSVGPHHIEDGVPVGYAQTREGAVAAASNFAQVRSGPLLSNETAYLRAIRKMSGPSWNSSGERIARNDLRTFGTQFGIGTDPTSSISSMPIRYRVESFTSDKAVVTVWLLAIIKSADGLQEVWAAERYTLVHTTTDWRIGDVEVIKDVEVPKPFESPHQSQELPPHELDEYDYAPTTR